MIKLLASHLRLDTRANVKLNEHLFLSFLFHTMFVDFFCLSTYILRTICRNQFFSLNHRKNPMRLLVCVAWPYFSLILKSRFDNLASVGLQLNFTWLTLRFKNHIMYKYFAIDFVLRISLGQNANQRK